MSLKKLTREQKKDILRYAHIFKNNLNVVKDYRDQLLAGNPDPQINDELVRDALNLGDSKNAYFWGPKSTGDDGTDKLLKDLNDQGYSPKDL